MCAALAALLLCSLTACGKTEEPERQDIFAMDTYMSLAAYGDGAREALAAAAREINRLEQELSRTVSASDIYKLNDSGSAVVSEETAALLQSAMTYSAATGGLFDVTVAPLVSLWGITTDSPRVPSQSEIDALLPLVGSGHIHMDGNAVTLDSGCAVDLGGIAKGYIADRMANYLRQEGVTSAIIDLGGNLYCLGTKPGGDSFQVGIQHPYEDRQTVIGSLPASDLSVVTSGVYERCFTVDGKLYHHILDTSTGYPVENDLLSVTIVSDASVDGDALSTACFALGLEEGVALIENTEGVEAVFVTDDFATHITSGLTDIFQST